jgi:hypothetical protein
MSNRFSLWKSFVLGFNAEMIHICKFYTGIRQMTPANLLFMHKLSYLTAVFIEIIMDEFRNCFFMEINDDFSS